MFWPSLIRVLLFSCVTTPTSKFEYYYANSWKDQLTTTKFYENNIYQYQDAYTYDLSGNIVSVIRTGNQSFNKNYTYQGSSLISYSNGSTSIAYKYNSDGIRTSQTKNGVTTTYILDGGLVLAQISNHAQLYFTYDVDGSLLSFNYQGNEYFYVKNIQGDIIQILDETFKVVVTYKYDAWGNIIQSYNDSSLGFDLANLNPYRYRSYRYDTDLELYYLQSRYYDPKIGRFMSADSINYLDPSTPTGLNLYIYCGNNPVMYLDPSGNFAISLAAAATYLFYVALTLAVAILLYNAPTIGKTVSSIIAKAESDYKSGSFTVYGLADENGSIFYIGRTKNPQARQAYHQNTRPGTFIVLEQNLTYDTARGLEQYYITKYQTLKPKVYPYNQINGISGYNRYLERYTSAAILKLADRSENEILNLLGW